MMGCNCAGYHDADIGWMVNFIKEFKESQENDFQIALNNYLDKYFNSFMMNAIYDEGMETITLEQTILADGNHEYNAGERTITIL